MIRNPNDIQEGAKKIRMLIAGYPGIGKSTLALSAPNPLHIDVDFGIDRIEPRYRKPYIQPQSYDEILSDLTPINLQDFDTLVFDTGGKLIEKQAQPDYKGTIKGGRTVMFEAKFTAADRMEQSRVLQSQQDYMDRHQALGARCFVIAGFSSGMVYCVPWDIWKTMKDHFGRKYVTEADLEKYQVQTAWNGTLLLLN